MNFPQQLTDLGLSLEDVLFAHSKTKLRDREIYQIKFVKKTLDSVIIGLSLQSKRIEKYPGRQTRNVTIEINKRKNRDRRLNALLN